MSPIGLELGHIWLLGLFSGALGSAFAVGSLRNGLTEMDASSSRRFHGPCPNPLSEAGDQAVFDDGVDVTTESFREGLFSSTPEMP